MTPDDAAIRMLRDLLAEDDRAMLSVHDAEGTYLEATTGVRRLLGLTPDEVRGRNAYEFFHPDDMPEIRHGHRTVVDTSLAATIEYRIRHASGRWTAVRTFTWALPRPADASTAETTIVAITAPVEPVGPPSAASEAQREEGEIVLEIILDPEQLRLTDPSTDRRSRA